MKIGKKSHAAYASIICNTGFGSLLDVCKCDGPITCVVHNLKNATKYPYSIAQNEFEISGTL